MRRSLSLLIALAVSVLAASGTLAQPATTPQEITINALQGEPDNIDPSHSSFSAEAAVIRQVFTPLLRFDEHLLPQPAAAASYDISPDGTVYTFRGIHGGYSDGVPVRAQDFEYSWKRILDPQVASDYADFFVQAGIVGAAAYNSGKVVDATGVGVRALDDQTLEVRLDQPFPALPNLAALWVVSPLRRELVEANPTGWTQDPSTYRGNGPYQLREWVHQDHITFVRNPYYQGWRPPTIETLTFLMVSDGSADFAAYLAGERDWALVPDANVQLVLNDPDLSQQARQYTELTTYWLQLNTSKPPLDNPLVRQALSKAIDRQAFMRDIASGVGLPATSIIPPGMPGYQPDLGKAIDFDPQGAHSLLAQAGFPNGAGFPRLVYSYTSRTANQRRAEFLQAQFKQHLNIDLELNPLESKAFQAASKAKQFDIAYGSWSADYPDPQDWFYTLFGCKGGNNKTGYCSPAVDQAIMRGDLAADPSDRLSSYAQAEQMIVERDLPVIPLNYLGRLIVVKPYVQNMTTTALDDYPGSFSLDAVAIAPH